MTKKRHSHKADTKISSRSKQKLNAKRRKSRQQSNISWIWIGLGVVVLILAAYYLLKPKDVNPSEISVNQAYQKYQQGTFFLDVRDETEWKLSHIPNSVNIPLERLGDRLSELPSEQDIVVVCAHGLRSKSGLTILKQAGFTRVNCLSGGLINWESAGYPLESN